MPNKLRFKRILLKLSGETFGERNSGINVDRVNYIANEIKEVYDLGVQIAIVVGGGNFIRGERMSQLGIDRSVADYMGMLGTVINALLLQNFLENKFKLEIKVMTSFEIKQIAESFVLVKALRYLDEGKIVIFAGGTGNPFFSTDTAAALRACQIKAEAILKATKVKGVFDKDPKINKDAKFLPAVSYFDIVQQKLKIIDLTSAMLALENKTPFYIFDVFEKGNLKKVVLGKRVGTEIKV